jgi:hypothetical protein
MRLFLYTSRLKRSGEGWTRMAGDKGGKERDRERERERERSKRLFVFEGRNCFHILFSMFLIFNKEVC